MAHLTSYPPIFSRAKTKQSRSENAMTQTNSEVSRSSTIENNERPLFIVGSPRSGTGFLRDLIRSHPRISIPPESHFIPHFYKSYGDPENTDEAIQLGRRIIRFSRIHRWGLDITEGDFHDCRKYSEIVNVLFSRWATRENKPRWGDKTPHYVRNIETLLNIFPNAQILHIIRDPRAISLYGSIHPSGPGNVYSAAKQWNQNVNAGRTAGAKLDKNSYLEIQYEKLLASPSETMGLVFRFLQESFPDNLEFPNPISATIKGPFPEYPRRNGSHSKSIKTRADAWCNEPSEDSISIVESTTHELMFKLGYKVMGRLKPIPPLRRRVLWELNTLSRHYLLMLINPKRLKDNGILLWGRVKKSLTIRSFSEWHER